MTNKKLTIKEMLEYNKLYESNSKKASELLSNINKKIIFLNNEK